jgi:hypothetical protein
MSAAEEDNTFVQKCGVKEQASELASELTTLNPTNVVMTSLLVECWTQFNLQSRSQKGESHTFEWRITTRVCSRPKASGMWGG